MKVYQCFLFNGEFEMLELRLRELYDLTDVFVLVEGRETFMHKPKPYHFLEHWDRFSFWSDKIRRVQFDDVLPKPEISKEQIAYREYETAERNAIMRGLGGASDEDVVIILDADEIPSRDTVQRLRKGISEITRLHMQIHYYTFNHVIDWPWKLPVALPYGILKNTTPNEVRHNPSLSDKVIQNAGWHLGFFGSNDSIRKKLSCYAEFWLNDPKFTTDENLNKARTESKDFAGREYGGIRFQDEVEFLPETVKIYREKYQDLGWFWRNE